MSLALVHEMKMFRKEIRAEIDTIKGGTDANNLLLELLERVKTLENKYMAMNARLGKRDG